MANFGGLMIGGAPITSIYGAPSGTLAPTTGIQVAGVDLNTACLRLADGVALGRNIGMAKNSADMSSIFGVSAGTLPINGKNYNVAAIYAAAASGTLTFTFNCTSTTTWATSVSRTGTISGSPPAGNIDTGTIPSGATQVRYTLTWLNASGDTGAATTVTNGASSATAIATNVLCSIALNGNGTTPHQTTYNFKIEFLNSSGTVISTTNFTVEEITEGSA